MVDKFYELIVGNDGLILTLRCDNRFDEEKILNAAYTYEQATKFRDKYKPEH